MSNFKMNKFQAASAGKIVSGKEDDIKQMIVNSTLPKGLISYANRDWENDEYLYQVRFNAEKKMWSLKRISKQDGNQACFEGHTLDQIAQEAQDLDNLIAALNEHGNAVVAEQAELENNWEYQEAIIWLDSVHGREYEQIRNIEIDGITPWDLIRHELQRLNATVTRWNLERAYCNVLDSADDPLRPFFEKAERKKRDDELTAQREAYAEEPPQPVIADPNRLAHGYPNRAQAVKRRQEEDSENRQKPLDELRREAIFGTKGGRVPSTGTAKRF